MLNRRSFSKLAGVGAIGIVAACQTKSVVPVRPKVTPLKKGDKVGLIAPGFRISETHLNHVKKNMADLGLTYDVHPDILQRNGYLAGSDSFRMGEIERMYADPSIKAVWCINGGYGTTRLLDDLNYDLIKDHPKPLIGFSDITGLMSAIYKHTHSPCFHGPMPGYSWNEYTQQHIAPIFSDQSPYKILHQPVTEEHQEDDAYTFEVIHEGRATGKLIGGNLSLIAAMMGTPHQLDTDGALLFLEDIDEGPYRIDRMLTQLISGGYFTNIEGIVFGIFDDCDPSYPESQTVREVVRERMKTINVPVMYGFSFGHVADKCTFPIGVMAEMDTEERSVTLLESVYA